MDELKEGGEGGHPANPRMVSEELMEALRSVSGHPEREPGMAVFSNAPRTFRNAAGEEVKMARLRVLEFAEIEEWLKKQVPDPAVTFRNLCEKLTPSLAIEAVRAHIGKVQEDRKHWPPSVVSPQADAYVRSTLEGLKLFARLAIKAADEEHYVREDAEAFVSKMTFTNLTEAYLFGAGLDDPKFQALSFLLKMVAGGAPTEGEPTSPTSAS
jgi:hypothetical protein